MNRRAYLSLVLILGLLMCRLPAFAAVPENGQGISDRKAYSSRQSYSSGQATGSDALEIEDEPDSEIDYELETEPDIATASNAEELEQWLAGLDGRGGEVTLEATITLEDAIFPYEDQSGPIRVCTGAYGLIYDGGSISALNVELTGEGVDIPVLEIRSTVDSTGWFEFPDWNNVLSSMDVTATGRNGLGGVAVRVAADSEKRNSTARYENRGNVHSYGDGAVGLELAPDHSTEVYLLDIDVEGNDACAVSAPNGADLFCCCLSAKGAGAMIASGEGIVLDTCLLSSVPDGISVIQRTIEQRIGLEPQIQQNAVLSYAASEVGLYDTQRYYLTGERYLDFCLDFDADQLDRLDTSALGPVDIPVRLPACLQGFGLEDEAMLLYRIWIRDPALPAILHIKQDDSVLTFFTWPDACLEDGTVLWISEDDGATWKDATDWEAIMWFDYSYSGELFQLESGQIGHPVLLALENGAGWSNVVSLTPGKNGAITPCPGGDRDGGDWEPQPGTDGGEHGNGSTSGNTEGESGGSGSVGGSTGEESGGNGSTSGTTETESSGNGSFGGNSEGESGNNGSSGGNNSGHSSNDVSSISPGAVAENISESPSSGLNVGFESAIATNPASLPDNPDGLHQSLDLHEALQVEPTTEPATASTIESAAAPAAQPAAAPAADDKPLPETASHTDLALSVFVLCTAAGVTALITFRKKRSDRR